MFEWFSENWLAAYAALVGTVALGLNIGRFLYARKRDLIHLKVSGERHKNYEAQLQRLREGGDRQAWERPGLVEVYRVEISNTGSIPAHLRDAGVITKDGQSISVLTNVHNGKNPNHLVPLSASNASPIAPKSSQSYWVWLRVDQDPFDPVSYFAIDKTGKKWSVNA
nr:hypothetical protein [Gammaproteobacteria bacterium]